MQREFEMSLMGELNYFLGPQIKQIHDGIFMCQAKYSKNSSRNLGLKMQKYARFPWLPQRTLIKMNKVKMLSLNSIVAWLIGSLFYLTASKLDIIFSVCLCARFQSCPKESDLIEVNALLDILMVLLEWACGIWRPDNSQWRVIQMPAILAVEWIKWALLELFNFLKIISFHDLPKNKIL